MTPPPGVARGGAGRAAWRTAACLAWVISLPAGVDADAMATRPDSTATSVTTHAAAAPGSRADSGDTLRFVPMTDDSTAAGHPRATGREHRLYDNWRRPPRGDRALTDLVEWRRRAESGSRMQILADYNRVDPLRLGLNLEGGPIAGYVPRIGGRYEYAFGRERALYDLQIEEPLQRAGRVVVGATLARRTDHPDLQQTEDAENSLALLFARQDYRDYFEREGGDVYVQARFRKWTMASAHWQADRWRSLAERRDTRSWFYLDRPLRANPAIDDGDTRLVTVRFERLARRTASGRPGIYHLVEIERAGGGLGGDFTYTRALADLRGVVRLSPSAALAVRALGGTTMSGRLPPQRDFTLGGVDGLRAHAVDAFRGNQAALAQAEYTIGLWHTATPWFEGGLHAIAFVDAGRAWRGPDHWDATRQRMKTDGGVGLSTAEDNLRVYVARDLQASRAKILVSLRMQRPF